MTLSDSKSLTANQVPEESDARALPEPIRFPERAQPPKALNPGGSLLVGSARRDAQRRTGVSLFTSNPSNGHERFRTPQRFTGRKAVVRTLVGRSGRSMEPKRVPSRSYIIIKHPKEPPYAIPTQF